jgi:hypothetical protein
MLVLECIAIGTPTLSSRSDIRCATLASVARFSCETLWRVGRCGTLRDASGRSPLFLMNSYTFTQRSVPSLRRRASETCLGRAGRPKDPTPPMEPTRILDLEYHAQPAAKSDLSLHERPRHDCIGERMDEARRDGD